MYMSLLINILFASINIGISIFCEFLYNFKLIACIHFVVISGNIRPKTYSRANIIANTNVNILSLLTPNLCINTILRTNSKTNINRLIAVTSLFFIKTTLFLNFLKL